MLEHALAAICHAGCDPIPIAMFGALLRVALPYGRRRTHALARVAPACAGVRRRKAIVPQYDLRIKLLQHAENAQSARK